MKLLLAGRGGEETRLCGGCIPARSSVSGLAAPFWPAVEAWGRGGARPARHLLRVVLGVLLLVVDAGGGVLLLRLLCTGRPWWRGVRCSPEFGRCGGWTSTALRRLEVWWTWREGALAVSVQRAQIPSHGGGWILRSSAICGGASSPASGGTATAVASRCLGRVVEDLFVIVPGGLGCSVLFAGVPL